ncbi:30S ribosomal protein S17 [Hibiscus syriacus]|uniref:30S ribosomal protein S17 n=1 Tax=Hibiscus syriacus TaxID=106335 RepID=A0A6A3BNB3_HIBSY|nr:30S ribosomal protein S17 [Hibiscus syriacus]
MTPCRVFRDAGGPADIATVSVTVEGGDEGSGGSGDKREDTVEISSENSGPARSRTEDGLPDEDDETRKKKRSREISIIVTLRIRLEKWKRKSHISSFAIYTVFKESPHPDEKQRQQLSKQLGLAPRQGKFWFQNRRTQIKEELEKPREENKAMRAAVYEASCPNCGVEKTTEEQQLRIENAKLKAEVKKLRTVIGKYPSGAASTSSFSKENYEN